ncbi:hypothetical protein ZIOFF_060708 [Zingiber officinale]|uniref:Uncharacterized protein n=1 Tax=Zingiber officinale TaxID=94328 RepID=A0A8J5FB21_ZINOF|nr:hypothetical protein ZIOFF_060708 [Zingiber officinale]
MASASSSSPFHGIRDREEHLQNRMKTATTTPPDHELQQQSSSSAAPAKKRRSQPGNPSKKNKNSMDPQS